MMLRFVLISIVAVAFGVTPAMAQKSKKQAKFKPTAANVPYGKHKRQVMDFYQAKSKNRRQ